MSRCPIRHRARDYQNSISYINQVTEKKTGISAISRYILIIFSEFLTPYLKRTVVGIPSFVLVFFFKY